MMIARRAMIVMGFSSLLLAACNTNTPNKVTSSEPATTPKPPASSTNVTPAIVPEKGSNANILYIDLKGGRVEIELMPKVAPNHVKRIKELTAKSFYDGIVFHRVIDGFMAQTGDPTGTGRGGSKLPDLKAEFSPIPFARGVLGMARSSSPNSANSQFFIMLDQGDFLNGQYTVFGKVIKGMEIVDGIKKGNKADNGAVSNPDKILKMHFAPNS